ncbi:hypothetical protein FE257_005782 [Aspergillus nanangensis]|uniref:Glycine zipper 2TM domain-containing protein n=1 Tax=Aspergillus nanangensis TaxID=2582783 RepID=A0AAD4GVC8_ASPNN|nr:hypothetical protein FE257_005782 [Aspergillus nanangensis]
MTNRDYYGNNVPTDLSGQQEGQDFRYTGTQAQYPDSQSVPTQGSNQTYSRPDPTQNYPYPEGQTQWQDPSNPNNNPNDPEAEKGLGSTVVGGAGGAFVGHKVGKQSDHGTLGAIGGAIAGAIAANLASNAVKNHGQNDEHEHGYESGHGHGHGHGRKHGCKLGGRLRERRIERLENKLDRLR